MKSARFGLHDLLYYGEAVGVLIAWTVGVAVVLTAGGGEGPVASPDSFANVSLSEVESED